MSTEETPGIVEDIQKMLFGLGDCPKPLLETALVLEEILMIQINLMLQQAEKLTYRRNATYIEYKDILFLIRKDKLKLQRLINYLSVKSETEKLSTSVPGVVKMKKTLTKVEECIHFLKYIGVDVSSDKYRQQKDPVHFERAVRANYISESLPMELYDEYLHSRRVAFQGNKERTKTFSMWLVEKCECKNIKSVLNSPMVFDMISFLSKEMIAEIVDMVFLIRRDQLCVPDDPLSSANVVNIHSILRKETFDKNGKVESIAPITMEEIQEVVRRFFSGQLNPFNKFNSIACRISKNASLITS